MEAQTLTAEVREVSGKGPARQLRNRGLIPAILYGPGIETQKITVSPAELEKLLSGAYGRNQLVELDVAGAKQLAFVRDLAINPVTRELRHADFYAVSRDQKLSSVVPLETTGRSIGVQKGGHLRKLFRELPVRAFPQDFPAVIEIDVANLDVNEVVCVKDLKLPEGVEVTFSPERRLVAVETKERKKADEEEEEAAAAS